VREATFDVLRRLGLTTIFSNPGSTEVPFLAGLPDDLEFVLALHEGAVVGMAAGYALGSGAPALVLLHSTPGLGNAVAAIATARANRAPLVVVVGQQDRRHLALEPFLAGKLEGLAGAYPVWSSTPLRAQDVPGTIVRAYHEAQTGRGPALAIVPMDDWLAPAGEPHEVFGPRRVLRSVTACGSAPPGLRDHGPPRGAQRPARPVAAGRRRHRRDGARSGLRRDPDRDARRAARRARRARPGAGGPPRPAAARDRRRSGRDLRPLIHRLEDRVRARRLAEYIVNNLVAYSFGARPIAGPGRA
jgi:hypothetical protein